MNGTKSWKGSRWNGVIGAAALATLATLWFPPVGAVLFVVTTCYAAGHFRQMPITTVLLVVATTVALLAAPGAFLTLTAHGGHDRGSRGTHGPPAIPTAPRRR
jgi:hypothetical protein